MPCSFEHGIIFFAENFEHRCTQTYILPGHEENTKQNPAVFRFSFSKPFFNAVTQPFAQAIICFYRQLFAFFCNFVLHLLQQ